MKRKFLFSGVLLSVVFLSVWDANITFASHSDSMNNVKDRARDLINQSNLGTLFRSGALNALNTPRGILEAIDFLKEVKQPTLAKELKELQDSSTPGGGSGSTSSTSSASSSSGSGGSSASSASTSSAHGHLPPPGPYQPTVPSSSAHGNLPPSAIPRTYRLSPSPSGGSTYSSPHHKDLPSAPPPSYEEAMGVTTSSVTSHKANAGVHSSVGGQSPNNPISNGSPSTGSKHKKPAPLPPSRSSKPVRIDNAVDAVRDHHPFGNISATGEGTSRERSSSPKKPGRLPGLDALEGGDLASALAKHQKDAKGDSAVPARGVSPARSNSPRASASGSVAVSVPKTPEEAIAHLEDLKDRWDARVQPNQLNQPKKLISEEAKLKVERNEEERRQRSEPSSSGSGNSAARAPTKEEIAEAMKTHETHPFFQREIMQSVIQKGGFTIMPYANIGMTTGKITPTHIKVKGPGGVEYDLAANEETKKLLEGPGGDWIEQHTKAINGVSTTITKTSNSTAKFIDLLEDLQKRYPYTGNASSSHSSGGKV